MFSRAVSAFALALTACGRVSGDRIAFTVQDAWIVECLPDEGTTLLIMAHSQAPDRDCVPSTTRRWSDCDEAIAATDLVDSTMESPCTARAITPGSSGYLLARAFEDDLVRANDGRITGAEIGGVDLLECVNGEWDSEYATPDPGTAEVRRGLSDNDATVILNGRVNGRFRANWCGR